MADLAFGALMVGSFALCVSVLRAVAARSER
jgi:hypothetical protein